MQTDRLSTKSLLMWFGVAVVLAVVIIGAIRLSGSKPGEVVQVTVQAQLATVAASDEVTGNKSSKVVLMEFSDFQCPACGAYYPIIKQVISNYSNKIQFVYRNFPLSQHPNALPAAKAAEAASLQGKYWEMHNLLFTNQNTWADKSNSEVEQTFASYAQTLGLDLVKFKADEASSAVESKIQNDYQSGIQAGVDATPTFYLDGKKLDNLASYNQFKTLLDAEIQQNQ